MALPWIEGEVFFTRDVLVNKHYNFNPNDAESFYGHMLIEHVWNKWTVSNWTSPNFKGMDERPHPRSKLRWGKGDGWDTEFGYFPDWWINFGNDRRGRNISRTFNAQPNQNRNEMRDVDYGGPLKVVFRPVPLGKEEFVFIDMTQPIRAVYFPLSIKSDESVTEFCTYLMVEFRHGKEIELFHPDKDRLSRKYKSDTTYGFNTDVYHTLAIHIPSLIEAISWPRGFRGENANLYESPTRGEEIIYFLYDTDIAAPRSYTSSEFVREIDLVTVLSAHQGISIQYKEFEFSNFIVNALKQIVEIGLGFIPGVGSLLSISISAALELMENPDNFSEVFGPSFGIDFIAGLIEAGHHFHSRSNRKPLSLNQPLTRGGEGNFKDRMPPPTSPKYAATSGPEEAPPADVAEPTGEVVGVADDANISEHAG